jgi:bifunctional non-homologous end joining protein LigD
MVLNALNQLNLRSTILDSEIVALDVEGIPRFQLLQKWQKRPTAPVAYILFDLLWDHGRDLTGKTVVQRRDRLEQIITPVPGIQVGGYIENRGIDLFRLAKEKGLEGIIAKRKDQYLPTRKAIGRLVENQSQAAAAICDRWTHRRQRKPRTGRSDLR